MARENQPQPVPEIPLRPSDADLDDLYDLYSDNTELQWPGPGQRVRSEPSKWQIPGPDGLSEIDKIVLARDLKILDTERATLFLDPRGTFSQEVRDELRLDKSDDVLGMLEEDVAALRARQELKHKKFPGNDA